MGTARDFHVKTGLVVDAGNVTLSNGNLLVNSGHIDIDNIKINGQTISTVAGNDDINITPHGTGSVVISKSTLTTTDINGGTIDGATIATSDITVGTGKTLDVSGGTLTLAADQISGNAINGGTIGSITITALAGNLSLGDNNITNVGDLNADSISVDAAATGLNIDFSGANTTKSKITLGDNLADALNITEASNSYMKFVTTGSSEQVVFGKGVSYGADGSGVDVTFYSATSGDKMLWDASEEQLVITGTDGATALNVADGNVTVSDTLTATNIGAFQASGAIDFNSQAMTNVDINSGAIDGATIGANSAAEGTFTAITGTTIDATTDFTIGSTVITDDVITFTPSTSDTVTLTAATNAEFTIATIDNAGTTGHINLQADGNVRLKYTSATKLETKSTGVDITGHLEGSAAIHSAHARLRASDGIEDNAGYSSNGTHPVLDVDGTNFYTSETLSVTETSGNYKLPSGTYGTSANNVGNVIVLGLNIETSSNHGFDTFQAAEAFCAMSIKDDTGEIQHRVVNKIYGVVNRTGSAATPSIDTIVQFQSGDVDVGHFHWVLGPEGLGSEADTMTLVFKYTSKIQHTTEDITTYSVNCNGLSLSGAGG